MKNENIMSPKIFIEELRDIKMNIKAIELTTEGKDALMEQVLEMEALVLALKQELSESLSGKETPIASPNP